MEASQPKTPIDWQSILARLEGMREIGRRTAEETAAILRWRARSLSRPLAPAGVVGETLHLLVVSVAGERYAVATSHVLGVAPLRGLTPVPGRLPFMLGVVNYQGRVIPVFDLRRLFGLAAPGNAQPSRLVAVQAGAALFAIAAEAVEGITAVAAADVTPPPLAPSPVHSALICGVTADAVALLDIEAMARDPRIIVKEEALS